MLDTVRMPRAVPTRPDRAALKEVSVRVSMLVAISARKVRVGNGRFVQGIIFNKYLLFLTSTIICNGCVRVCWWVR